MLWSQSVTSQCSKKLRVDIAKRRQKLPRTPLAVSEPMMRSLLVELCRVVSVQSRRLEVSLLMRRAGF